MGNITLNWSSEYLEDVTGRKVYIPEDSAPHEAGIGIDDHESDVNRLKPDTPRPANPRHGCIL